MLALAFRDFPKHFSYWDAMRLKRHEVETELTFLGFLVMENELKPISKSILNNLTEAKITVAMATGDNALTAISVGKDCNIVNPAEPLYLGEFEKEKSRVVWRNVHHDLVQLDSITFEPQQVGAKEEVKDFETYDRSSDDKLCEENSAKQSGRINNVDLTYLESSLPWVSELSKDFSVAMTGDAFKHVLHQAKENP